MLSRKEGLTSLVVLVIIVENRVISFEIVVTQGKSSRRTKERNQNNGKWDWPKSK